MSFYPVPPSLAFIRQGAAYTLTSTTNPQQLFNTTTNGALTLPTGVYNFDLLLSITGMSATSGNGYFSLAGTATLDGLMFHAFGRDGTTPNVASTVNMVTGYDSFLLSGDMFAAATATGIFAYIVGAFEVTAAGTIIPSIALTTAAAAASRKGNLFRCTRIGAPGVNTRGDWS